MEITFLGAAETVTGSCYLVKSGTVSFLVDCGMFQGADVEERNAEPFSFDPRQLDFVILTHAHMDHSGLLPKLTKNGFNGSIYMTPPTAALSEILLMDAAKIQENNLKASKYSEATPYKLQLSLYASFDAVNTINKFKSVDFDSEIGISDVIKFRFIHTGHILGAASVVLEIEGKTIIFSGDIGRTNQSIISTFATAPVSKIPADTIIMESLYGGITHPDRDETINSFLQVVNETLDRNGNVIVPTFAVHRTQELLEILRFAFQNSLIKNNVQVFLDSPLAIAATEVYTSYSGYFNSSFTFEDYFVNYGTGSSGEEGNMIHNSIVLQRQRFNFDQLRFSRSHKQSLKIGNQKRSIILAGSGMADGGRILHHLTYNLQNSDNSVVFVGFQAEGTLGRQLVEGAKEVVINRKAIRVNANIAYLKGFSAHADNGGLLAWLDQFQLRPGAHVYLTHADPDRSLAFKQVLAGKGIEATIPDWKEQDQLS